MNKKDILNFWRNIEIFDLPDLKIKDINPLTKENLPWQIETSIQKDKKKSYILFFGKISKINVINQIEKLFPEKDQNKWEEKMSGFTCFSSLVLDENGQPDSKSYNLASFVLGMDVLQNNQDISSVYRRLQDVNDAYLERFNFLKISNEDNSKGNIITQDFIDKEIEYLSKISKWNKEKIEVYFTVKEISKNAQVDAQFLNSFYLDDLNRLIDRTTILSPLVQNYLSEKEAKEKFDLEKNKEHLFNTINPELMTEGKWASNPKYGLYTAQLGAVNTIFNELEDNSGLQGVNGPPGTGKTTLLLDVIAQIMVNRAKKTIKIGVDNIFGDYEKVSKYVHTYQLHSDLQKNYGIVVASNNNSAVENISKELPQTKKIDKFKVDDKGKFIKDENGNKVHSSFPDADYFTEFAKKFTDEDNWGILAAALGKSENKNKFCNIFWKSFTKDENDNTIIDKSRVNFYNYLEENQIKEKDHRAEFEIVKKEFCTLLDEFKTFKNTATEFHNKLSEYLENTDSNKEFEKSKNKNEEAKNHLAIELQRLSNDKNELEKNRDALKTLLDSHNAKKPLFFFIHKLFKTQSFISWNDDVGHLLNDFNNILSELRDNNSQFKSKESEKKKIDDELKNIQSELNRIEKFRKEYEKLKSKLCEDYQIEEKNIFDENFHKKELEDIHLLSPYHSEKIAKLRSKIFLKALDVHKYAILANAKQFKNNLNAFFEMILGRVKVSEELTTTLWDSFFFCVPVVSTSLASASRLFPDIIEDQIGWLLIDEAGQATPQSAVGLIQRSKRSVIVGDPIQVEPVVTIPKTLVNKLTENQNIIENWSPYNTSVQQLADRISKYGTSMKNNGADSEIWTGFPLRTHRRCNNPMFTIANDIAYNQQMVKGTQDEEKESYIGKSTWFDVNVEGSGENQVIKEEIDLLKEKIKELRNSNYTKEIYIISPFKAVSYECKKTLNIDNNENSSIKCGTIHTFQGKEADVVFLVLGSQPESVGSRKWASSKPNMLNVALTRAKKRIYVIGNKTLWREQPFFDVMIERLEENNHI